LALETIEHPGRVRTVGFVVGLREYFGSVSQRRSSANVSQEMMDELGNTIKQQMTEEMRKTIQEQLTEQLRNTIKEQVREEARAEFQERCNVPQPVEHDDTDATPLSPEVQPEVQKSLSPSKT